MIDASRGDWIANTSWLVSRSVFFNKGSPPGGIVNFFNVGHLFPPVYSPGDLDENPPVIKASSELVLGLLADKTQASKAPISS